MKGKGHVATDTRYPKGSATPHSSGAAGTHTTMGRYGGSGGSTTSYKGDGGHERKGTGRHRVTMSRRNGADKSADTYPKRRHGLFEGERYY